MSLCYFSIQRSDNGKTDDVWEFDETYRGLCHEESLHFYRICLYKNYKKTERICTTGIADKRDFFACFFVVSLFFIILLKQVMLPRILQIAFAVITLLFLGIILLVLWLLNHLQNQNRELLENSILRTQLREQEKLMKVSEESNQKIREVRHDIRRYFSNYLQLLEEGKVELVKKKCKRLLPRNCQRNSRFIPLI